MSATASHARSQPMSALPRRLPRVQILGRIGTWDVRLSGRFSAARLFSANSNLRTHNPSFIALL
jgi:hypothetical protein